MDIVAPVVNPHPTEHDGILTIRNIQKAERRHHPGSWWAKIFGASELWQAETMNPPSICEGRPFELIPSIESLESGEPFPVGSRLPAPTGITGPSKYRIATDEDPIVLRVTDFDSDGYPDLIAVVSDPYGSDLHGIRMLRNQGVSGNKLVGFESVEDIFLAANGGEHRSVITPTTYSPPTVCCPTCDNATRVTCGEAIRQMNIKRAAMVDIGNGVFDIVASGTLLDGRTNAIVLARSQMAYDAFHIKVSTVTGGMSQRKPKMRKGLSGATAYGVSYKLSFTDLNGQRLTRADYQLSQTTHSPLQSPFAQFGLGRTNNYVDALVVGVCGSNLYTTSEKEGVNRQGLIRTREWKSFMPNTHVVVEVNPINRPNMWTIEQAITPSRHFLWILVATVGCLQVVGLIVILLDRREKLEDVKAKQGFRRQFIAA
eukprot:GHVO01065581.1.p1 GENE.GHVO01065581.1~~GHVO01065581.1.p1  ORF type:complete len:428 (+),score=67.05 GHVO01065581.1:206-1489(+)